MSENLNPDIIFPLFLTSLCPTPYVYMRWHILGNKEAYTHICIVWIGICVCVCVRVRVSACTTRCDARPSCCPTLSRSWSRFCLTHLLSLSPFNSRAFFPPAWPVQGAAAKIPVKGRHKNPANPPISFCLSASVIELPAQREREGVRWNSVSRVFSTRAYEIYVLDGRIRQLCLWGPGIITNFWHLRALSGVCAVRCRVWTSGLQVCAGAVAAGVHRQFYSSLENMC